MSDEGEVRQNKFRSNLRAPPTRGTSNNTQPPLEVFLVEGSKFASVKRPDSENLPALVQAQPASYCNVTIPTNSSTVQPSNRLYFTSKLIPLSSSKRFILVDSSFPSATYLPEKVSRTLVCSSFCYLLRLKTRYHIFLIYDVAIGKGVMIGDDFMDGAFDDEVLLLS